MYFVHSFRAVPEPANADWVLATTDYGGEFVSALKRGEARQRLTLNPKYVAGELPCC